MTMDNPEQLKADLLQLLDQQGQIDDSQELCRNKTWNHESFVGALKSLQSKEMVNAESTQRDAYRLTSAGEAFVQHGSSEYRVYSSVPADGITRSQLAAAINDDEVLSVGLMQCNKRRWLRMERAGPDMMVTRVPEIVVADDETVAQLRAVQEGQSLPAELTADLKRRKLISRVKVTSFHLSKGPKFALTIAEYATELTSEMLASGSWRSLAFKPVNFKAKGLEPARGRLHPLLKQRSYYRSIFLEMGFQEMPTNNFVESSFWNFDALFQPQQHPSRDAHDTFFLREPARTLSLPESYVARVKEAHEAGCDGSIGWRYPWKLEETYKNILRTHTTAVSARMLYALGQQKTFTPIKYFSIDRVYRNEKMDATHLAEFHQVEGLIADYDLTLGNLMGILRQFFFKLGITDIRFKPAFNPYTEPSMEVFGYHPVHKRWLEIGNSGMFRPEMLRPMGLPENVRVIAWGLSLERPLMIKHNIENIRTLVGAKCDLAGFVKCNPIVRDT